MSYRPGRVVVDEAGGVSWFASRPSVLPAVEFQVGPGVHLVLDPLTPASPLGWVVDPDTDPAPLAEPFDDRALASLVSVLVAGGPSVSSFDCPDLTSAWAQRGHVASVARWTLRPLDNGALLLDEGLAELRCGHDGAARRLFGFGEYALLALGERAVDSEIPRPALELVRELVAVWARLGLSEQVRELAEQLVGVDEFELAVAMVGWAAEAESASVGPLTHSRVTPLTDVEEVTIDPTVLAPRIIAWAGPEVPELQVNYRAADQTFVLIANLARGVDPWCAEANELLAYRADPDTGRLLAVAPVTAADDGVLSAELPAQDDPAVGCFGLFSATVAPELVRAAERDLIGIEIDRELLHGWNLHRRATALRAADAESPELDMLLMAAETAIANGRAQLGELAFVDQPPHREMAIRARIAAVGDYLDAIGRGDDCPGQVLLCELVAPESTE
ncbi:hypothetical protein [Nocardia sp. NPDC058705]|uniref:hypothetical protein n=1 Tax=Nocardia sp. NPDC058705 TaxID=3346609 RepID=UPI003699F6B4